MDGAPEMAMRFETTERTGGAPPPAAKSPRRPKSAPSSPNAPDSTSRSTMATLKSEAPDTRTVIVDPTEKVSATVMRLTSHEAEVKEGPTVSVKGRIRQKLAFTTTMSTESRTMVLLRNTPLKVDVELRLGTESGDAIVPVVEIGNGDNGVGPAAPLGIGGVKPSSSVVAPPLGTTSCNALKNNGGNPPTADGRNMARAAVSAVMHGMLDKSLTFK